MSTDNGIDVAHYRQRLQQHRSDLQQMCENGGEAARPVELDQSRVGRLSRMDALQGQAMSLHAGRRREQELVGVAQALQRLLQGDTVSACTVARPSPAGDWILIRQRHCVSVARNKRRSRPNK